MRRIRSVLAASHPAAGAKDQGRTNVYVVTDRGSAPLDDNGNPLDDFDWVILGAFRTRFDAEKLQAKTLFVCPDHDVQVLATEFA